tara:strand:- start:50524 stop:56700 length:6177 start_codon:yes stop_codon:yes gene_type:complete
MSNIDPEIASLLAQASQNAYQDTGGDLFEYIIVGRESDPGTGLAYTVYENVETNEYIIAFRGTEPSSQDIYTDLNAGIQQWSVNNRQRVQNTIRQFTEGKLDATIHFTGHSLGGAIAQFAAYEYALAVSEEASWATASFDLVTFNALGGELALSEPILYPDGYNSALAASIPADHYKIAGDVVSRLGDDHIGGQLLVVNKPTDSNLAAHGIGNFTGSDGSLRVTTSQYDNAVAENAYLNITQLLSVSGIFASFYDDEEFTSEEALLRTISAFSFGLANADSGDLSQLVGAFFGDPEEIGQDQFNTWVFIGEQAIEALQYTRQLTIAGNLVGAYALVLANVMQWSAQKWEENPELADILGVNIDRFIDYVAKPAISLANSALGYALVNEFVAEEFRDTVDYITNTVQWVDQYFSQQSSNRMYLQGFGGDDLLSGDDTYWAGKDADDYILGYAGNDTLIGGLGTDYLIGGTGTDRFIWDAGDGNDIIGDYDDAGDRIIVNGTDLATLQFTRESADSPYYGTESRPDIQLHYDGALKIYIGSGPDSGSVTIEQYTPATGADFGIVLNDYWVPVESVTDVTVANLGSSDTVSENETRIYAYDRQKFLQRGLNWSAISISFDAADVSNYTSGSVHGLAGGHFEGGPVADYLTGNDGHNALNGLGGNDHLAGYDGWDLLEGWSGSDEISGGDGVDVIFGSAVVGLVEYYADASVNSPDPLRFQYYLPQIADGPDDVNTLSGNGGADFVGGGEYVDKIAGGAGSDHLLGGTGSDFISGGTEGDDIFGDSALGRHLVADTDGQLREVFDIAFADGADSVGQYNDVIHAGEGDDRVWGELGDDEIHGEAGADILIGDRDSDTSYAGIDLQAYADTSAELDAELHGNDRLYGGEGGDLLLGLGGDDLLSGGTGADQLLGGAGNDTYSRRAGDGLDYIEDTEGTHTLLFSGISLSEVQVIFQGDQVRVGTGSGSEGFFFSKSEWDNTQIALNTPDAVIERSRLDYLYFDTAGSLLLTVYGSEDLVESDRDELFIVDSSDPDKPKIVVASGVDEVEIEALADGGAKMRVINGSVFELLLELTDLQLATGLDFLELADGPIMSLIGFSGDIVGTPGNDRIIGSSGADTLRGAGGSDLIEGRGGNDELVGGTGSDILRGESGDDTLIGGNNGDYLDGGKGNDDLVSDSGDTLYFDANDGQDRLTGPELGFLAFGAAVDPDDVVLNYTGTSDSTYRIEYGGGSTVTSSGTTRSYWLKGVSVDGVGIPLVHRSDLTDGTFLDTRWNDVFDTGSGNDTIFINGWGDDVIQLDVGDGQDTVSIDNNFYPEVMGEIQFGADIDLSALSFAFNNGRATISYGGSDQILLDPESVFSGWNNALSHFTLVSEADPGWIPEIRAESLGGILVGTYGTDHLINSNNGIIIPGYGDDTIQGGAGSDWIFLNDVYIGTQENIGQKEIWGGGGNELVLTPLHQGMTFHYNRGDGLDTIKYDWSYSSEHPYTIGPDFEHNTVVFQSGGSDTLEFGAGITLGDLRFLRVGNQLNISLSGDAGGIILEDYFHAYQIDPEPWAGDIGDLFGEVPNLRADSLLHPALLAALPENPIAQLVFADGSTYDMASVLGAFLEVSNATLVGTEGNDSLSGTLEDDVIHALGGDDYIEDFDGSNIILAGAGNDRIVVAGNNSIDPGPGDDWINLIVGNQIVHFGPGSGSNLVIHYVDNNITFIEMAEGLIAADIKVSLMDGEWGEVPVVTLKSTGDSLTLHSIRFIEALDDFEVVPDSSSASLRFSDGTVIAASDLYSMAGVDGEIITGTEGVDILIGTAGNDTISGGRGKDFMDGAGGDDIFLIEGRYEGKDRIIGGEGFDIILGGDGNDRIKLVELSENDGIERIDGGSGVNVIVGSGGKNTLDFSTTTLVNISKINGRRGRDTITGSDGADVIIGGRGNDVISGGAGDDTYLFSLGDGRDVIRNADRNPGSYDSLRMEDIDHDQVWLSRKRNHLVVNVAGTTDRVIIKNWYGDGGDQLEGLYAGDYLLMRDQVDQLVNAMAAFDIPEGVGVIIPDETLAEVEPVLTSVWQLAS